MSKYTVAFAIFLYIVLDVAILYAMFMTDITGVRVYALAVAFVAILALIAQLIDHMSTLPDNELTP